MKCFNIPGPFDHFALNMFLLTCMTETHKEAFYPNIKVSSVFGNFHFCIWDGGRNFERYTQLCEENIIDIADKYKHFEVPIRLIFTNPEVEEKHLHNRYCNMILDILNTGKNEIVVNSPLLEDYLRNKYPNYKYVSSTTKRIISPDKFLEELNNDKYYQVCLDYDLNKNKELINSIPKELRNKCEFLINAICPPHCPVRKRHYSVTGKSQLSFLRDKYILYNCGIKENITHPSILGKGNNFTLEEIDEYNKLGYKYFKLEGRTLNSPEILAQYLYYMVKPEWYWEIMVRASYWEGIFYNDANSERTAQRIIVPSYSAAL